MRINVEKLVWNVIYHDVNADRICVFNIFEYYGIKNGINEILKAAKTKEAFSEELRRLVFRYFGYKCEWEIVIKPWCGSRRNEELKVDVYWQIRNNWDVFVDYIWNSRE